MTLVSIEHEIDAGVNVVVADAGKLRDACPPLRGIISEEGISFAREWFGAHQMRKGGFPCEPHLKGLDLFLGAGRSGATNRGNKTEERSFIAQHEPVSRTMGYELSP